MIVTVTLNTALDKTSTVPNFEVGRRHRAIEITVLPGGHGINVARSLKNIGYPVIATGLLGGQTGMNIAEQLTREGIPHDFIRIKGESRTSTAIIDPASGSQTEINEFGPRVYRKELSMFIEKLEYLSKTSEFVIFCGSIPPNIKGSMYSEMVRRLRSKKVLSVLDAAGEPLRLGIKGKPYLIKPNQEEAETIVGYEFQDEERFILGLERLRSMGAQNVIVTNSSGFYATIDDRFFRGFTPDVEVVSTVGSGDAFVAGLISGMAQKMELEESMLMALAAGAANAMSYGAGHFQKRTFEELLSKGEVTEIKLKR